MFAKAACPACIRRACGDRRRANSLVFVFLICFLSDHSARERCRRSIRSELLREAPHPDGARERRGCARLGKRPGKRPVITPRSWRRRRVRRISMARPLRVSLDVLGATLFFTGLLSLAATARCPSSAGQPAPFYRAQGRGFPRSPYRRQRFLLFVERAASSLVRHCGSRGLFEAGNASAYSCKDFPSQLQVSIIICAHGANGGRVAQHVYSPFIFEGWVFIPSATASRLTFT